MADPLPKILIVDDKPANLFALRRLLQKVNAEVVEADSGMVALTLCMEQEFAMVLLDVHMPEMTGFEVAELLYGTEQTRDLPLIFVTAAYSDEHHKIKGYDLGAVDYIQKPVDDRILLSKVNVFLELFTRRRDQDVYLKRLEEEIAGRKELEKKLRIQAELDVLTGLPNRVLFQDRLSQALSRASRHGGKVVLCFIDLDRFKQINDTLGHDAGDQLLQEASKRINDCIRHTDTVARLGGDEFTVILPEMTHPAYVELVVRKILEQLARPFQLEAGEAYVSGSVGITVFPNDGFTIEDLIKNADTAMYRAKDAGRSTFRFFTPEMDAEAKERSRLERGLRHALERGEIEVYYQPIIDLQSGSMVGAEALSRWFHPEMGEVPPDKFIPLAEECGLIQKLGKFVLRMACRDAAGWNRQGRDQSCYVAVNISSRQWKNVRDIIEEALFDSQLPGDLLQLEITENICLEEIKTVITKLEQIRLMGPALAVDDFGTGYSSLSYLQQLPVALVKIDRSFVRELPDNPNASAITGAIIAMARSLDLKVVAEGVENLQQMAFLRSRGCQLAQGFLFSKPLPPDAFTELLELKHSSGDPFVIAPGQDTS
ncbi:MAG: EAL domain-containing protein [Magnetococcales bacterium]|nr:EAL domain-containing protein [Magnetococcales bacterium]